MLSNKAPNKVDAMSKIPQIVLLPGMDGTGKLLEKFEQHLSLRINTKIISYPREQELTQKELIDHIQANLPSDKFILLGESFSGPLAIQLAVNNRDKIIGLILVSTFLRNPVPSFVTTLAAFFQIKMVPKKLISWVLLGQFSTKPIMKKLMAILFKISPNVISSRIKIVANINVTRAAGLIKCPVLYLVGTQDRLISKSVVTLAQKSFPNISIKTLNGPHMLATTHPKEAATATFEFASLFSHHHFKRL